MKKKPDKQIDKETFKQALIDCQYENRIIYKYLQISRDQFYRYLRDYDLYDFRQSGLESQREEMINIAESALMKKLLDGNWNAIVFVLSRLGKDIYSEKQINEVLDKKIEIIKPKYEN